MEELTVSERLQAYFAGRSLSMAQVSRETGIQYDTLQQILYGRVKSMGIDKFTAIWQTYPDIDGWYVLTGLPSLRDRQQVAALTTVEQLIALKTEIIQSIDSRIQQLGR
ncbi:hypothetical protein [Spirosoma arcticum]